MRQVTALMLAGEVPILVGDERDDFLRIAECLLSSADGVRIEADPTLITFEDLWARVGDGAATALVEAVALAGGETARTVLAVVAGCERSGARFWLPALANRARRGLLPRRLLICATMSDRDTEESEHLEASAIILRIDGAINVAARGLAPLALNANCWRDFEPEPRPEWLTEEVAALVSSEPSLAVDSALRAARAVAEARALARKGEADQAASDMIALFAAPRDAMPALTVLPGGKSDA
jgi:hypothetical protein